MKLKRARATGDEACTESFHQVGTRTRAVTVGLHGRFSAENMFSLLKLNYKHLRAIAITSIRVNSFQTVEYWADSQPSLLHNISFMRQTRNDIKNSFACTFNHIER